jgi:hypothetical protein
MGYNYDWLTNVFLSSGQIEFPSLTAIDRFTGLRRVSAICPPFSGYEIKTYQLLDKNRLVLTADSTLWPSGSGYIDIIFMGPGGYTKLSDKKYLIGKDLTNNPFTNFILLENSSFLLKEDGFKLIRE